jgi:hypothetical protein
MAITQVGTAVSAYNDVETAPALQFSLTPGGGTDFIVVSYAGRSLSKSVFSITFGAQSFTQAVAISGNTMDAEVWYLVPVSLATANITVTLVGGGTFVNSGACAVCLSGVAQTLPIDDTDTATSGSADAITLSALTSTTDGCVIVDAVTFNSAVLLMTAETNRVEQANFTGTRALGASTIITKSPAGSVTMQWSTTPAAGVSVSLAGVAFKPSGGAPPTIILMGEGLT